MNWINYNKQRPPTGVEVIAYHHKWVNEDFNPRGVRVGFLTDDGFISAFWWDTQDDYISISDLKCNADVESKAFYQDHLDNTEPEYWTEIPDFQIPEEDRV